jgi:FKBP-type peptidyl-prolyl cis-trans isomerase
MSAAFDGKAIPLGSASKEEALEASRRLASYVARARQSVGAPAPPDLSLPAFSLFGSSLVQSGHFAELGWNDTQFDAFLSGMRAAFLEVPVPMDPIARQLAADIGRRIAVAEARGRELASIARDPNERLAKYIKQMRRRLDLQISDSGLGYNVEPATPNGVRPRPGDTVVVNCQVAGPDGVTKIPPLSAERVRAKMEELVPGLREGLQMMTIGNQAVFLVPPSLSYGDGSWPEGAVHGAPMVYTVTLLEVIPGDTPP